MSQSWYIIRGTEKRGPLCASQLRQLTRTGHLRSNDLLLEATTQARILASSVNGLFDEAESMVKTLDFVGQQLPEWLKDHMPPPKNAAADLEGRPLECAETQTPQSAILTVLAVDPPGKRSENDGDLILNVLPVESSDQNMVEIPTVEAVADPGDP